MIKPIEFKLASDYLYAFGLGHCQVTYFCRNEQGQRLVYCLQEHYKDIRLMRCAQDGEPMYEVKIVRPVKFEKPTGNSRLETKVINWIDNYEKGLSQ